MSYLFSYLQLEYAQELASVVILSDRASALSSRVSKILDFAHQHESEWDDVEGRTGVPRLWGIASFEREASSNYGKSPAQGDPWNHVSENEPRGMGPYSSWGAAACAAYNYDGLQRVGASAWTWTRACYEGEAFNGFGVRAHGRRTGYLWSWTNQYEGGKYVEDRKWSPTTWDAQCGMVPLMLELIKQDQTLKFCDPPPSARTGGFQPPHVVPAEVLETTTQRLQTALNALGADPRLVVDGNYGRATRRAVRAFQLQHGLDTDGVAGPATWAAVDSLYPQRS